MRRYFSFLFALSLSFGLFLIGSLKYDEQVAFYHLLVISVVYLTVFIANLSLRLFIKSNRLRATVLHIISGSFFFAVCSFYVLAASSNIFWKKTITINILGNYATSLGNFLSILPVEKWLLISAITLLLLLMIGSYTVVRPQVYTLRLRQLTDKQKWMYGAASLVFLLFYAAVFLFWDTAMQLKRTIHFREEPILQFVLGGMWGRDNDLAFNKQRYANGLKDSTCINAIRPATTHRPVVLILVDDLRSDHMPAYGYQRQTTPFLDSMYQTGALTLVKQAYAPSTMTIGGIAGLFFSKDWHEFGFNGLNLMKFLQRSGYKTNAYLTGFHRDWYGLSALYRSSCDYYYESATNPMLHQDDDFITLEQLEKAKIEQNSFIYLHLLSVHVTGKRHEPFQRFKPYKVGLSIEKKTALVNNYDNGILQADFVIKRVFEKLKKDSLLGSAIVFILSDHGEAFGEANQWGHGGSVAPPLVSVPLLIYDQDSTWYKNKEIATLKDIAPTIANRLGMPVPSCWEGNSLHLPPSDFTMLINAVEPCEYPYGLLQYQQQRTLLNIYDRQRVLIKTLEKLPAGWQQVPQHHRN